VSEPGGFSASRFTGSVPAHYDQGMGPVLFAGHAQDLSRRLAQHLARHPAPHAAPGRVLEVACGTGILTAALLEHLPSSVQLSASDLNPAMLGYAAGCVPADDRLGWLAADVRRLPLADRVLDAAACQFGLMFVPDRAAALAEIRRALRPAGVLAFNVWHDLDHNPFARITRDAVAALLQGPPPAFFDVPFGWHDRDAIVALLERGGFEVCEVADLAGPRGRPAPASLPPAWFAAARCVTKSRRGA
jgi:Methylase involved in ubiquinone/menaquinone biosynthesis